MFRVRAKAPTKDATVPTWYEKAREHVKTGLPSFALRSVGRGRKEGPVSERAYPGRKVGTATAAAAYAGLSRSRSPPSVPPSLLASNQGQWGRERRRMELASWQGLSLLCE